MLAQGLTSSALTSHAWTPGAAARPANAEEATFVDGADRHVISPIPLDDLDRRLENLARTNVGAANSPVQINDNTGDVALISPSKVGHQPEGTQVLPMRLGALRTGLHQIENRDSWLMSRDPVFYMDREGAHVDFVNLAGFVFDPVGTLLSHSCDPS